MIEENFEKKFTALVPLPMCVVNQNGKILSFTTGADNLAGWTQKVDKVLKEEK